MWETTKKKAWVVPSKFVFVSQAHGRMQESCQKVELLRLSLERRLNELPQDHPRRTSIKEELESGAHPPSGTPKKSSDSPSLSYMSSFFKPASLTGCGDISSLGQM